MSVHVILLDASSRLLDEARDLHASGRARLVVLDPGRDTPFDDVRPGDAALVGTSVPSFFLHHLLRTCTRGGLGSVRVLDDGPPVDPGRIGLRWGPWLQAVCLPADQVLATRLAPAPMVFFQRLGDLVSRDRTPPVRFTELPSPFPERLQLQTTSRCTRGCPYCPKPRQGLPDRQMDARLFDRLMDECAEHEPSSLELYLHAEPLEDPRLEELADRAAAACPRTLISVTTHERAVTLERFRSLAACGLDAVFVSVNATGGTSEASLASRLGRLVEPARALERADKQLVVVTLTNLLPDGLRGTFRRLCREFEFPVESFRATTRVGDARLRPGVRVLPSEEGCLRPFTTAHVLADGRVAACCEDWQYRRILGDVSRAPMADVWTGDEARRLRRELLDESPTGPCDHCGILPRRGPPQNHRGE